MSGPPLPTPQRVKLMNQLLVGIRVLKMYAWETAQEAAVRGPGSDGPALMETQIRRRWLLGHARLGGPGAKEDAALREDGVGAPCPRHVLTNSRSPLPISPTLNVPTNPPADHESQERRAARVCQGHPLPNGHDLHDDSRSCPGHGHQFLGVWHNQPRKLHALRHLHLHIAVRRRSHAGLPGVLSRQENVLPVCVCVSVVEEGGEGKRMGKHERWDVTWRTHSCQTPHWQAYQPSLPPLFSSIAGSSCCARR